MSTGTITRINRRIFLKTGAAGATGLVIGFYLPGRFEALAASPAGAAAPASMPGVCRAATLAAAPAERIWRRVSSLVIVGSRPCSVAPVTRTAESSSI